MTATAERTILAGDLGGTKTLLALFSARDARLELVRDGAFASRTHATFDEILDVFLAGGPSVRLDVACFDVAGPVADGRARTTNLPWTLEEGALAAKLGVARVKLLNDLEATAYGMLHLEPTKLACLNPGRQPPRRGHVAVIAAGTGLGEAYLFFDGERHHPIASEGGHADFAPRTELEIGLLRHLYQHLGGRVSYERVLSGPGLFAIYEFLRDTGLGVEPDWLRAEIAAGDPSAVVSQAALARKEPLCVRALDVFCELYGAEAANMALRCLTYGGVYVGGGIAPKILPALRAGFPRGYLDKGRFSPMVAEIPVHVALEPRAALLGAANFALRV